MALLISIFLKKLMIDMDMKAATLFSRKLPKFYPVTHVKVIFAAAWVAKSS